MARDGYDPEVTARLGRGCGLTVLGLLGALVSLGAVWLGVA